MGSLNHDTILAMLDLPPKVERACARKEVISHWTLAKWREMNVELRTTYVYFEHLSVQESVDLVTDTLKGITEKYVQPPPQASPCLGGPLSASGPKGGSSGVFKEAEQEQS